MRGIRGLLTLLVRFSVRLGPEILPIGTRNGPSHLLPFSSCNSIMFWRYLHTLWWTQRPTRVVQLRLPFFCVLRRRLESHGTLEFCKYTTHFYKLSFFPLFFILFKMGFNDDETCRWFPLHFKIITVEFFWRSTSSTLGGVFSKSKWRIFETMSSLNR